MLLVLSAVTPYSLTAVQPVISSAKPKAADADADAEAELWLEAHACKQQCYQPKTRACRQPRVSEQAVSRGWKLQLPNGRERMPEKGEGKRM